MIRAYIISTRGLKIKHVNILSWTKQWKWITNCESIFSSEGFFRARHTIRNKPFSFPTCNFVFFLLEVSICCTVEIYNEGSDISSCPNTTYKNLHIIFILKTTSIGSHVGEKLRSRLIHTFEAQIHTLTWLNFDYHWLCVWFGSCENRRLTQSRSSGVLHGWPGVKNASAAPNKISRTQLGQTPNFTWA